MAQEEQLANSSLPLALASDGQGFLWVGTQNGLARWDGSDLRMYNAGAAPDALHDSQVDVLHTDVQGRLWIGTPSAGLALYNPRSARFKSFSTAAGLSHVGVHAIADAPGKGLWIGTEAGLDEMTGATERIRHILSPGQQKPEVKEALTSGVGALATDQAGVLWIGTKQGLLRREPATGAISPVNLGGSNPPSINALMVASDGRLWVGSEGQGAYVVNPRTNHVEPVAVNLKRGVSGAGMRVRALLELSPEEVWLATYDDGMIAVDPADLSSRRLRLGNGNLLYGDENLRAMSWGAGGLVFIASNSAITRFDPRSRAFETLMGGQAPTAVLAERTPATAFAAPDGKIWIGYMSHGVDLLDPKLGRIVHAGPAVSDLPKVSIRAFATGLGDSMLVASDAGLYRTNAKGRQARRLAQPGRAIDARVQDLVRQGSYLWVAGLDGLWRYRLGPGDALSADIVVPADRLTDRRITTLTLAEDGGLWIGTENGLNRYDLHTHKVEQINPSSSEEASPHGFISSIAFDSAGRLWVTNFGQGVFVAAPCKPGQQLRFRHIGVAEGLPNANANKMVEDDLGYMWISTDGGLARIDPHTFKVRAFRVAEGVPVVNFFYRGGLRTSQGELLFPGRGGLVVVRPDRVQPIRLHAPLVVTDVRLRGHLVPGDPFLDLAAGESLRVPPGAGLEVGFAALDYGAPAQVRYAYRLLGANSVWTEADPARRLASYTNVAPGRYELQIRAVNATGRWPDQLLRLPVNFLPAWYQTAWFHGLGALAVAGLVLLLIRWRTSSLQHRRRELEALVAHRTVALETQTVELEEAKSRAEALTQAKSDFLANMSHEIRTPLNGVVAVADILARSNLPEKERGMAEIIRSSGDILQRLVSDILDTAQIESGKITIEQAPFQLGDMLRSVAGLSQLKCDEKGVGLVLEMEADIDRFVMGDMVRIRQVVTNLLSNAVKFTEAGEIRLSAEQTRTGHVRFRVSDTGIGFSMSDKPKVLGRFQQADSTITRRFGGSGLGLSICVELAGLMGGVFDCESEPGGGARFWMELPLDPADQACNAVAEESGSYQDDGAPIRILVADDHPTNRKVIELMLEGGLAELTMAENGVQALDAFRAATFDVILMDMQMPVMDGLTAIVNIRALEAARRLARTPIIMLTANALPEHVTAAQAAGADRHLAKPFTAEQLLWTLDVALQADTGQAIIAA